MKLLSKLSAYKKKIESKWYSRFQEKYDIELALSSACRTFSHRNDLYDYFHHYYHHRCPKFIRDHRKFITDASKGFGEEAFHAMWWLVWLEYQPQKLLEIGVYRGQTISLWSLIAKYLNIKSEIHGISPFAPIGDSVSDYLMNLDYYKDTIETFHHWGLNNPVLVKALSTDLNAVAHIESHDWDLIYIDGSHDFEIVLQDYKLCLKNLKPNGLIVLDDASLNTGFNPPSFSFGGHPGPSRVAREYADKEMAFVGAVGHNNIYQKKP